MMKNDLGQASLDFLAGIIIFMGSLVMVMQFIPGIFTPFQTEATDLNAVAYRTGVLLLEDPGWWSNTSTNKSATDWENHLNDPNATLRIGLANVDATNKTIPNVISKTKVEKFANKSLISNDKLTEFLGLYRNISGYKVNYSYNISLFYPDGISLLKINGTPITAGVSIPIAQDIAKIERLVQAPLNMAQFDASSLKNCKGASDKACININGIQKENVLFEITNFNITSTSFFQNIKNDTGGPLNRGTDINDPSTDYVVWKKTITSDFIIAPSGGNIDINRTDTLRFEMKKSLFGTGTTTFSLNFKNDVDFAQPGPPYADFARYLKLVVEVWQ